MRKLLQLQVEPAVAADESLLEERVRSEAGVAATDQLHIRIRKRSIDARGRKVRINLTIELSINEAPEEETFHIDYPDVSVSDRECHIIGMGPAGLFAALRCLELGIKPVLIERGKDVKLRRRDLAAINKEHVVNAESNYCFGEGGAGTYSDGKLYTRSNKRGDIGKILRTLVFHGASRSITVDAHPHIGTNKLPQLIQQMRETILAKGGEVHFNTKLEDIVVQNDKVSAIRLSAGGNTWEVPVKAVILATGHSARDIYQLFHGKNLLLEAKPFAMGVRVEHPQELIDSIQYHCSDAMALSRMRDHLPAASYSLVHQSGSYGVYSFCMCPGGIIAPCATFQEEVVTNGWSPSKRNNPFANSGIVVGLSAADYSQYAQRGPLAGLELQRSFEHRAWELGGKRQTAPAQRLVDFVRGKRSADLPACSYLPGVESVEMGDVLGFLAPLLRQGFTAFGNKMRGYLTNEAIITGVESRTSTPVRIPREADKLHHPQLKNLFPCGEGAGYAGGIVSAAMDGERCAEALML